MFQNYCAYPIRFEGKIYHPRAVRGLTPYVYDHPPTKVDIPLDPDTPDAPKKKEVAKEFVFSGNKMQNAMRDLLRDAGPPHLILPPHLAICAQEEWHCQQRAEMHMVHREDKYSPEMKRMKEIRFRRGIFTPSPYSKVGEDGILDVPSLVEYL
jgi:hypothetical protein